MVVVVVIMISPLIITFLMTDKLLLRGDKTHPVFPGPGPGGCHSCDRTGALSPVHLSVHLTVQQGSVSVSQSPPAGRGAQTVLPCLSPLSSDSGQ